MIITTKFYIGQSVYLITDGDQIERVITEIWVRYNCIQYYLMQGIIGSWHYDFEISEGRNIVKATNG